MFHCNLCKRDIKLPIEKMTDVNLATDLLTDAFFDNYRTAIVISADSDLIAPVKSVKELFSDKRVIVAMPPGRWSQALADSSTNYFQIEERQLRQCQLPDDLKRHDNYIIKRPSIWR